jgi:outer membrane protein TolC
MKQDKMKSKIIILLFLIACFHQGRAQTVLTMEQAMSIAEKNSPTLQSALFNLERTKESLNAQRAALKSNFSLNVNPLSYSNSRQFEPSKAFWYTKDDFSSGGTFTVAQPVLLTDGVIALSNNFSWGSTTSTSLNSQNQPVTYQNKSFINKLNLSLTQPLFTYNRTKANIKGLELDQENAMLNYAIQRLSLEKSVAQYFFNVYMAQMSLTIKQDELTNTQKSYDIIKNKVNAGLSALGELYQAEVSLATAKSGVESSRVSLENAKDILKQLIGMDIFENITVMADVVVTPVQIDGKKAIEHGLASRMELRQRQINIENAQLDMLAVKAQNEFRGDMKLSIGLTGDNENLGNIYDKGSTTRSPVVSLGFNIPVFDWGEKKARIRAQEAIINTQKLNSTNQETQIKVDIREIVRNLDNLKNQIGIALENQKNSQLTYDINLERYKNGDLTSMDLNLFQQQLSSSKMSYAQSLINYKIELLNLKIQSLYDFTTNESVLPEKYIQEYRSNIKSK